MAFEVERRLRFGDCDPAGIAYFPAYIDTMVGVTEEFFASLGSPWPALLRERRIGVPTVKLDCEFVRPGFHGDLLVYRLAVTRLGTSSVDFAHTVSCGGRPLWRARQTLVATSLDTHRAIPWPDDLRAGLAAHLETVHA